jgi:hypothetical protein
MGDEGDEGAGSGEPSSWRREPARMTRWRGYARSIFSSSVARRASSGQPDLSSQFFLCCGV